MYLLDPSLFCVVVFKVVIVLCILLTYSLWLQCFNTVDWAGISSNLSKPAQNILRCSFVGLAQLGVTVENTAITTNSSTPFLTVVFQVNHVFYKRTFGNSWHMYFTGKVSFLLANQHRQSTEGNTDPQSVKMTHWSHRFLAHRSKGWLKT